MLVYSTTLDLHNVGPREGCYKGHSIRGRTRGTEIQRIVVPYVAQCVAVVQLVFVVFALSIAPTAVMSHVITCFPKVCNESVNSKWGNIKANPWILG